MKLWNREIRSCKVIRDSKSKIHKTRDNLITFLTRILKLRFYTFAIAKITIAVAKITIIILYFSMHCKVLIVSLLKITTKLWNYKFVKSKNCHSTVWCSQKLQLLYFLGIITITLDNSYSYVRTVKREFELLV